MQRFFIIDPSLKDGRGHHYALSRAVTTSAIHAGFEVVWLCSKDVSAEINAANHAKLRPVFGAGMYDNYADAFNRSRGWPAALFRLLRRAGLPGGHRFDRRKIDLAVQFETELAGALKSEDIGPADRLLMHTADGASYVALARLMRRLPRQSLPVFHVVTPYDPVGVMPNRDDSMSVAHAISILGKQDLIDRNIFLYAENRFLADHLTNLWGVPVRPQELPCLPPSDEAVRRASSFRRQVLRVDENVFLIVSLGSARLEKGFDLFPEIIAKTAARIRASADAPRIKFVLHASPQIVGRHSVIADAISKLGDASPNLVSLIHEPLSDEDYENLLLASDAVILPYVKNDYLHRSSAIVAEAVAAGKILIATRGSYPGRRAIETGGAVGVTPEDFASAVVTVASNPDRYRKAARRAGQIARERDAVDRYAQRLLETEKMSARRTIQNHEEARNVESGLGKA